MVDFEKAIKRPFQDFKKLGIGALFLMIPVINIITGLFSSGYSVECARTSMKKDFKLPEWKDWGKLIVNGFFILLIGLIYMLPVIIIGFLSVGTVIMRSIGEIIAADMMSGNPEAIISVLAPELAAAFSWIVLILLLALVIGYVLPMAFMSFAEKGVFADAFNFNKVFRKAFTSRYLVVWLVFLLISILVSMIAGFLSGLTAVTVIIPWIISGFASMIVMIIQFTMFGEAYKEIR